MFGRIHLIVLAFILLGLTHSTAQNSRTDSLYKLYEAETNDSLKAVKLNKVIARMIRTDPDSAIVLAKRNIAYAEKSGDMRIKGQGLLDIARSKVRLGKYEEALSINEDARPLLESIPDSNLLSIAYQGIGIANRHLGRFEAAMNAQLTVIEIREAMGGSPQPLARAFNNIAAVLGESGDHKKAIEYFRKSLDIWKKENNPESMAICYINIGGQAVSLDDFKLAEDNLSKGLMIFDSLDMKYGIGAAAANLGNLYMRHEKYQKAKEQFIIALDQYTQLGDEGRMSMFLSDLGLAEAKLKNYQAAIRYQQEALEKAEEANRLMAMRDVHERLADVYAESGAFEKAYQEQELYYKLADSIFNENTAAQLNELEIKYKAEKKDQEIGFLKKEKALQDTQNTRLIIGVILLCLLSAISIYAFFSSKSANRKLRIAQARGEELLREKEELIEQLKQTQLQLIQQEKMASLGQLSAGIAHEINNPVNFVSGNAEALIMDLNEIRPLLKIITELQGKDKQEAIDELIALNQKLDTNFLLSEIMELSESIKRGSNRIQTIVGSLKSFSHSSGEQFQEADLNEILDATLAILTHKLKLKDTQLEKEYAELPKIMCQPGKISQVTMNILDNAIDAIPRNGKIHLSTQKEGDYVLLSIQDNGKGIPQETQNKIFDPFFTTKDIGEGSGLGLAISYGIVKDHGGSIDLESQPDQGTNFVIRLPITPA